MSEFIDYYNILDIPTTASMKEIRNAYYRLVKIHHPDQGGSAKRFQSITEAYECLSNQEKRNEYDASLALNSNKESVELDILMFRNQHKQFVEENKVDLTQEEIDDIYNSNFSQIKTEKFTDDDITTNINNIKYERKNVDDEFENTDINLQIKTLIEENKNIDVNDLFNFMLDKGKNNNVTDIQAFDNLDGINSFGSYFSNGCDYVNSDGNEQINNSFYTGINSFENSQIKPLRKYDADEFNKWKDSKKEPEKINNDNLKDYMERRKKETEEIDVIIHDVFLNKVDETRQYLSWTLK